MTATAPPRDLLRTDILRAAERQAAATLAARTLMQRAGGAAADWIVAQGARRVRGIFGPGNNGGERLGFPPRAQARGGGGARRPPAGPGPPQAPPPAGRAAGP